MRYDLTDFEWSVIEPVLPRGKPGPRRKDDRRVLNGIFWVLRAGAPWRDLLNRYGPYATAYNRFRCWRKAGVWDRLMDADVVAHLPNNAAPPACAITTTRMGRAHRVSAWTNGCNGNYTSNSPRYDGADF
jgi:transposase